ncbi:MAG: hypothetical protein COU40_03540 [Candidatus Moranbacteria bacterium CG10_big_fil_rev_8_21_14_0_10_35_21]|nr:MAG: hypothetical protein COU40_03540 [Candidatus Moranbacteria bacterium CG10_big_fil_rev_8_21_14_0_10_35_21]PJA88765.1 MAG: hypothetical protein CO139_01175 [Candidatus Moranbacteria bacterium CG_4_9_14_3_um_filter_36_9]
MILEKKLKEALDLLGGKAVVFDSNECYIFLTLKEFRKIKKEGIEGLTKQELIDKINNDIAAWKISQEQEQVDQIDAEALSEDQEEEIKYERS